MSFDALSLDLATLGVDKRILALIGVAGLLMLIGGVSMLAQRLRRSRTRLHSQGAPPSAEGGTEAAFASPGAPLLQCAAELVERRPLSEAQWDSPVPAAWTIFRLRVEGDAELQLGLLLPVQHKEAYSAGFFERVQGAGAETLLAGLAKALGGPVPSPAISGSSTGFLEFKTYVQNEKPDVIPGNLDLSEADYWILAKVFVQNTLEFYMRLNAGRQVAEIAAARPAQGEELMRVLAATLRPDPNATPEA